MSTFACKITRVEIRPHPNADKLELATPVGTTWQCVTGKGNFVTGDLAIYLPIDSVLPQDLVVKLGIEKFCKTRIKTLRLRGELAQGLLAPLSILPEGVSFTEGADVAALLGITKYDPPIPVEMSGIQRKSDDRFSRYTDLENAKNFPDVFKDGDFVVITEKIHGSSFRSTKIASAFAANGVDDLHVGSHNCDLVESEGNLYWRAARLLDCQEKLEAGEIVYGEAYGNGVQDLVYGMKPGDIFVKIFDIKKDDRFLPYGEMVQFLLKNGWENMMVPVLYVGQWNKECLKFADGMSILDPTQIREGCVVKPMLKEEFSMELHGRKALKIISDRYLERKDNPTERH